MQPRHVASLLTNNRVRCEVTSYNHERCDNWKATTDGSLTDTTGRGSFEVVSPILRGDEGLLSVKNALTILDADSSIKVNRTCGLHVHHYAEDMNPQQLLSLLYLYHNFEGAIDSLVAPSRRGNTNQYCHSIDIPYSTLKRGQFDITRGDVGNLRCVAHSERGCRFHKLNLAALSRHGTVEFRQHQGTTDPMKAINWAKFTGAMVEASRHVNFFKKDTGADLETLFEAIHLDDDVANYLLARRAELTGPEPVSVPTFWLDISHEGPTVSAWRVSLTNPANTTPPTYRSVHYNCLRADNRAIWRINSENGNVTTITLESTTTPSRQTRATFYHKGGREFHVTRNNRIPSALTNAVLALTENTTTSNPPVVIDAIPITPAVTVARPVYRTRREAGQQRRRERERYLRAQG